MPPAPVVARVAEALARARRVGVLTGAGVSAESGVPTFRGPDGLWRGRDPASLATPEAFDADPAGVWDWYSWRRRKVGAADPNPAHRALARLEAAAPAFLLATQNVDGLHQRAGSRKLSELHGNLWVSSCRARCGFRRLDAGPPPELGPAAGTVDGSRPCPGPPLPDALPRCACGALLRPGVVWFGEPLPPGAMDEAEAWARTADVYMVVGTSAVVWPAAGLAYWAAASGSLVVEINPEPCLAGPGVVGIPEPAGQALPALVAAAWGDA